MFGGLFFSRTRSRGRSRSQPVEGGDGGRRERGERSSGLLLAALSRPILARGWNGIGGSGRPRVCGRGFSHAGCPLGVAQRLFPVFLAQEVTGAPAGHALRHAFCRPEQRGPFRFSGQQAPSERGSGSSWPWWRRRVCQHGLRGQTRGPMSELWTGGEGRTVRVSVSPPPARVRRPRWKR